MPRTTKTYDAETKQRVIAGWMSGESLNALTASSGVPKTTIQTWVKGRSRTALVPKPNELNEQTIDDLAWEWTTAAQRALLAILRKIEGDSWLAGQNAHDHGVLYGIIADKQLRLLAAFKPRDENASG